MIKQIIFVTALVLPGVSAYANGVGNGGGGWVCTEPNGAIRWSQLVDLFEAKNEFALTLATYTGSVREIVDLLQARLLKANMNLYEALIPYFEKVDYLENKPPQITHTQDVLTVIDDSLFHLRPSPKRCAGGKMNYEQVVNYKNNELIVVQSKVFNSFSNTAKAALVLHEAVYAYERDSAYETNSINTRRIVGLVLSTLSTADLKQALEDLSENNMNAIGMKFQKIPKGSFLMGSPKEEGCEVEYKGQHSVTIASDFEMQTTPVTQYQWFKVMGNNPSFFSESKYCPESVKTINGVAMCPNHPVEQVSWIDTQTFLYRFNARPSVGYVYRLPTEAEWEYAARAGTTTAYFFGSNHRDLEFYAIGYNVLGEKQQTAEVGILRPNSFGLYDLYGHVKQWVQDFAGIVRTAPRGDPTGRWLASHVVRGGSYSSNSCQLRSASRGSDTGWYRDIGFRLVRRTKLP